MPDLTPLQLLGFALLLLGFGTATVLCLLKGFILLALIPAGTALDLTLYILGLA